HSRTDGDRHEQVGGSRHTELGSQELLKAGREIHLAAGQKMVLDAGAELTLNAGGSMIKLDPSGITLLGPAINMNTGGSPGKGSGVAALLAGLPVNVEEVAVGKVPDSAQPQQVTHQEILITHQAILKQASLLRQAAKTGQGVCEVCEAAKDAK
ncbi:hypothetical protein ACTZQ0_15905, partial [Oceanimonas smirnovii]